MTKNFQIKIILSFVLLFISPALSTGQEPAYFYANKNTPAELHVSAKSYLVGDLNTGEVILSKNQDQKWPITMGDGRLLRLVEATHE